MKAGKGSDSDSDIDVDDSAYDEYSYHNIPYVRTYMGPLVDNDGRFVCECRKTYKEERYLRYHRKWECGKLPTFPCPACDYSAKRRTSLRQHIERRHLEICPTKH